MTFKTTSRNGVNVTFANGYLFSTQWNSGNYCSNRNLGASYSNNPKPRECATAEVAAWDTVTGDYVKLGDNDDFAGWQTPEQVLALMVKVAALPPTVTEVLALPAPEA